LGVPNKEDSLVREKMLVEWLDRVSVDASEVYLLGDIFDFWYEYKTVVPRGYVRLLGKLAELTDKGIKITMFKGNHEMWMFGYF
jgi:UDP-2,3-diacylglucosamine hydrolase